MAEVTGVRTEFTVQIDVGRLYEQNQTADPASMLALVGSLLEEGAGVALWRELLAFRDERERIVRVHRDRTATGEPGSWLSVIHAGLAALEARDAQTNLRSPA